MDFGECEEREIHLTYSFTVDGEIVSENTCLFTPPKHYYFNDPKFRCEKNDTKPVTKHQCLHKDRIKTGVEKSNRA